MTIKKQKLGLVLSGGGARGAYEAGVIHYLRTMLPREIWRQRDFSTICGSSVGAINACFMAATAHDIEYQGKQSYALWKSISQADIYKRDVFSIAKFLTNSFYRISKNVLARRLDNPESIRQADHFRGLLNTAPFIPFLKRIIPWQQISLNIKNRVFEALSVTATNIRSGKLELFIEKHPETPYTGHYVYHDTKIEYAHAMASAAIPLIFPTVKIKRNHYADGGLRLNTPLSPAIQLGAEQILVIGPHNQEESSEIKDDEPKFIETDTPPSLGMLLGKILSSIFLDRLDYDIEQLDRINNIIDWGKGTYGDDFLERINDFVHQKRITGDIANRGLKKLKVLRIYPSQDLRDIFSRAIGKSDFLQTGLSSFEKTLLKVLDVDLESGKDFLSFILFYPDYIKALMDLGFEDARSRHDDLLAFLAG